jgi:CDP-2,3-bis-(O-geranylgeranyl)-sn-glycerol synthase
MWHDALTALLFFLPAGIANTVPVFAAKLPVIKKWEYPLDFYKEYQGKRIFGDHKTIRGLITGMLFGVVTSGLIQIWYLHDPSLRSLLTVNLAGFNFIIFGLLSGFGALAGDAAKSFFKRRTNLKPGATWFPFDQIDFVIGACLCTAFYVRISPLLYLWILVIYFGLHLLSTYVGYLLGMKEQPL